MLRVTALTVSTGMKDQQALRDSSIEYLMGYSMRCLVAASASPNVAIPVTPEGLLPYPAVTLQFHVGFKFIL